MNPRALVFFLFGLALEVRAVTVESILSTTTGEATLINCDFESDFCQWYMRSNGNDAKWQRTRGPTPTNDTGPSHDHTTGDGYYIFLDAFRMPEASLYRSFSRPYSVYSTGACLSFWYYMHGEDVHTLELRTEENWYNHDSIHWSLKGPQGDQWLQHNISIKYSDYSNLQLVFTAKRGYFPRGDIALDDISIDFDAPCEYEERAVTPKEAETTTETPYLLNTKVLVKSDTNFVYADSRIELECRFDEEKYRKQLDEGTLRVFWYKRDKGSEYGRLITSTWWGNPLLFYQISQDASGFYWCAVQENFYYSNTQASNTSEVVEINVVPDPRPSPPLEIAEFNDGIHRGNSIDAVIDVDVEAVVTLVCGEGINGGEYHWTISRYAFTSSNLPKDRILVINSAQPEHSGVYTCRISKDGFLTAKSNKLELRVRPGRYCTSSYNCYGDEYLRDCSWDHRCECANGFVPRGTRCWRRPLAPKIKVYPDYPNFDIGDSFYLVCEADEPAPAGLTYTFRRSYFSEDFHDTIVSINILKILNATEGDSGNYSCSVTLDGFDSMSSSQISISIQDFNLNCDFSIDHCEWSQRNESVTATFSTVLPVSEDGKQSVGPSGPFLQLNASKTQHPNRAVLVSPVIDQMAVDSCLSFWYRTHGPNLHSMSVWKYEYSHRYKRHEGIKLWNDIGDRDKLWVQQNVTVGGSSDFYITIAAVGQVAIDDITFTSRGPCRRH